VTRPEPLVEHVEEIYSDGGEREVFADWHRRHPNARILSWIAIEVPPYRSRILDGIYRGDVAPFRHGWRIVYREGGAS
jgi:hypothetical protein